MGRPLTDYRSLSLWHATADDDFAPRPSLPGPASYDVAIVGAGLTGLWTAYYLHRADPTLRIVVLEAEVAGFGASGRNGGWCSALFPTSWQKLVAASSEDGARRMIRAMQETVREVGRAAEAEGIDAHFHRGGTVTLASSQVQLERLREEVASARARGFTEDDERLLEPDEASAMLAADPVLGGTFTPHCAVIHPSRLVRGLARVVEASGVPIFEHTRVQLHRARPGGDRRRHGPRRDRAARDRGLHGPGGGAAASGGAGVLADGRDRAAHRRDVGDRSGSRTGRRSPTRGT